MIGLKELIKDLPCKLQLRQRRLIHADYPELFHLFEIYGIKPPLICIDRSKGILNASNGIIGVVLYEDTLKNLEPEELFALILHEMGHKKGINFLFSLVEGLAVFYQIMVFPIASAAFFLQLLLTSQYQWSLLDLIIFLLVFFGIFRLVIPFFVSRVSMFSEKRADMYAVKILKNNRYWLSKALVKMSELDKLGYRANDRLMSVFYYLSMHPFKTHPPLKDRVRYINEAVC